MKLRTLLLSLFAILSFGKPALLAKPAKAQVTSNQPTTTFVNSTPFGHLVFDATGQQQQNLFHSFSQLNTQDGRPLNFVVNSDIRNVIGRVTDSATVLNGLVTITSDGSTLAPQTNLFLLSPLGISFGPNTITNIDGAFVATTASGLSFANDTVFVADSNTAPMLSVSTPTGLQWGAMPSGIQVDSINRQAAVDSLSAALGTPLPPAGVNTLLRGQNVILAAGDIDVGGDFASGEINLLTGRLQLAAIAQAGELSLKNDAGFLNVATPTGLSRADVTFSNNTLALATGPVESINISARNLLLQDGSFLLSGALPGIPLPYRTGNVNIDTTQSVQLFNGNIYSASEFGSVGDIGDVTVNTQRLYLTDSSQIGTIGRGVGDIGSLTVNADESIVLDGQNSKSDRLTGLYSLVGDLFEFQGSGQVGDVTIRTPSLTVQNGALITASTLGEGDAGNLNIIAKDILVDGFSDVVGLASSISSSVEVSGTGDGGNVNITADSLTLDHGGAIFGRSQGQGNAGDIDLTLDNLTLLNGGQVVTTSFTAGNAGDIDITVKDRTVIEGSDPTYDTRVAISLFNALGAASSGIYANTSPISSGTGGNIVLRSQDLSLRDDAQISVSSQGTGAAGSLKITATEQLRLAGSTVQAESRGGSEGNIEIDSPTLLLSDRAQITTNATGSATGGNITLNTPFVVASGNSDIVARATEGAGGRIDVNTSGLFGIEVRPELTPNSDINASSDTGFDGTVAVSAPDVSPSDSLVKLPSNVADSSNELTASCRNTQQGQFVATGRGGLPPNATRDTPHNTVWSDVRAVETRSTGSTASVNEPEKTVVILTEADQWHHNPHGQIVLASAASTLNPEQQATCLGDRTASL